MTTLDSTAQSSIMNVVFARAARFVKIDFSDAAVFFWEGIGTKVVDGETYVGIGNLGSIAVIGENAIDGLGTPDAQRLSLTLNGLPASLMAECRDYAQQGRTVTIKEAQLTTQTDDLSGAAYVIFVGQIDTMSFTLGEDGTLSIELIAENFLAYMFRGPDGHRRTNADQQEIFPGDLSLQFVGTLTDKIPWGDASAATTKATVPRSTLFHMAALSGP